MALLRHRSRHVHATVYNYLRTELAVLGWINPPINFGTEAISLVDYQPDERGERIEHNTVAVSIGDVPSDREEELGANVGGLRSGLYPIFIDVYMADQSLAVAMCDDIRQIFDNAYLPVIDQVTGDPSDYIIDVEEVFGPQRPNAQIGAEQFKRYWRIMRLDARVYYNS